MEPAPQIRRIWRIQLVINEEETALMQIGLHLVLFVLGSVISFRQTDHPDVDVHREEKCYFSPFYRQKLRLRELKSFRSPHQE